MSIEVASGLSSRDHLLPDVQSFLDRDRFAASVGGRSVDADQTFETVDPGTGKVIARVADLEGAAIDSAVDVAGEAFRKTDWATMPVERRCDLMRKFADRIETDKAVLAQIEALDAGKIESQAVGDVENLIATLRYFADVAAQTDPRRQLNVDGHDAYVVAKPWGPCGFIFPWNFPLLLIGWGVSPALAAGNPVVIKPAEDTSLSALYLAELANEVLPPGIFNVVTGLGRTAGAAFSQNANLKRMSFTGSPEVGKIVARSCGENLVPVKLELGGKGAAVVFDDVDVESVAAALSGAITFHTGQVCCDATRWFVSKTIYNDFVEACIDRLREVKVGYQLDADSQMGPVVNAKQRERVLSYLERGAAEGADAVLGGGPAEVTGRDGFYVKPALLAGSIDNIAAREEIFGPVAFLAPFDDEASAIEMVNATDYGLANSVWTTDGDRAKRVAEHMVAGNSWINAHNVFVHGVPYGGIHKSGMGGGVLSPETFEDYLRKTSIVAKSNC